MSLPFVHFPANSVTNFLLLRSYSRSTGGASGSLVGAGLAVGVGVAVGSDEGLAVGTGEGVAAGEGVALATGGGTAEAVGAAQAGSSMAAIRNAERTSAFFRAFIGSLSVRRYLQATRAGGDHVHLIIRVPCCTVNFIRCPGNVTRITDGDLFHGIMASINGK